MFSQLTAEIRFRCPSCQKLYCSDESAFNENSLEASEFECVHCQKAFFLYSTKTETGLYRTELTSFVEFSKCPKCDYLKPYKQDECPHCHVLESKFNEIKKMENPRLYELEKKWNLVVQDLMNDQLHQDFLDLAQSKFALNFASQKYSELQKMMGQDELIEKYMKQIEIRLEHMVQNRFQQEKNQSETPMTSQTANDLLSRWNVLTAKDLFMAVGIFGTVLLIYNKINPTFPNLTGLIVAATVLSYGLWFLSSQSKNSN